VSRRLQQGHPRLPTNSGGKALLSFCLCKERMQKEKLPVVSKLADSQPSQWPSRETFRSIIHVEKTKKKTEQSPGSAESLQRAHMGQTNPANELHCMAVTSLRTPSLYRNRNRTRLILCRCDSSSVPAFHSRILSSSSCNQP
jgi:hypothetical protein